MQMVLLFSDAVNAHQQFFGGGGNSSQPANAQSMGMASAMQALSQFTGGGSGNTQSGNSQNAFIGMAMGQARSVHNLLQTCCFQLLTMPSKVELKPP